MLREDLHTKKAVVYVHGKGGSAEESAHYRALFPEAGVLGLDYRARTPREAGHEIHGMIAALHRETPDITLVANSVGAFFCLCAGLNDLVARAYFISPIVDMERLIGDMLRWSNATEADLRARGTLPTAFGETLAWADLCYVRAHPVNWRVPTCVLYGSLDNLTTPETIRAFCAAHAARLTVMEGGEHWFHTEEQMRFLDDWIRESEADSGKTDMGGRT